MKKKIKKIKLHIGVKDFIKAIKIADRKLSLGNGFISNHSIYKNKKVYDRKKYKKINIENG